MDPTQGGADYGTGQGMIQPNGQLNGQSARSASSHYKDEYSGYSEAAGNDIESYQPAQIYDGYGRPYSVQAPGSSADASTAPADHLPPAYGATPSYGSSTSAPHPASYLDRKVDHYSQAQSVTQETSSRRPLPSPIGGSINGRQRGLPATPTSISRNSSSSGSIIGGRPLPGVPRVPSQSGGRPALPPTPEWPVERERVVSSSSTANPLARSATANARVVSDSWDRPPPPPPRPLPNPAVSYYTPQIPSNPTSTESPAIYRSPSPYESGTPGVTRSSTASSSSYFPSLSHSQASGSASMTSGSLSMSTYAPHAGSSQAGRPVMNLPTIQSPSRSASPSLQNAHSPYLAKDLPPTPAAPPMRTLDHARSFVQAPANVAFPSPHPATPKVLPDSSSGHLDPDDAASGIGSMMTRESSLRSNGSEYASYREHNPESSGRGASGSIMPIAHPAVEAHRRRSSADPAPLSPSWGQQASSSNPPSRWVQTKLLLHQTGVEDGYYAEDGTEVYDDDELDESEDEANEMNFFNPALLSHVSVQLKDKVSRGKHIKGGIPWVGSFTGRDLVVSCYAMAAPPAKMIFARQASRRCCRHIPALQTPTVALHSASHCPCRASFGSSRSTGISSLCKTVPRTSSAS